MDRDRMADYMGMVGELRAAGIRAEVYLGNPKNFGNQLKYADKTDEQLLYIQCEKYIESKEFFLQKAIGWALRQHSKFQPSSVRNFVANHKLSTVSLREAKKYI